MIRGLESERSGSSWSLSNHSSQYFWCLCGRYFSGTFFNSRRCCIPFIDQRSVNGSVEFIRFADVIADSTSNIISTRNIFVHPWGKYPTLIGPTCSKYTCRAYVPITCRKGFYQSCARKRFFSVRPRADEDAHGHIFGWSPSDKWWEHTLGKYTWSKLDQSKQDIFPRDAPRYLW